MNRFKGASAPWVVVDNGVYFEIKEDNHYNSLADVCGSNVIYDEQIHKKDGVAYANACLIALAPELLEVLIEIVEMQSKNYGNGMNTHMQLANIAKKAKIVIAKALGETK